MEKKCFLLAFLLISSLAGAKQLGVPAESAQRQDSLLDTIVVTGRVTGPDHCTRYRRPVPLS